MSRHRGRGCSFHNAVMRSLMFQDSAPHVNIHDFTTAVVSEWKQHFIQSWMKYNRANIYRRMFLTLWPPSLFLFSLSSCSCFFSHRGFEKYSFNLSSYWVFRKYPSVKVGPCRCSKSEEMERYFEFEVGYMWCCGCLYGVWLSVTPPDPGRDNMWVSQTSVRHPVGWDTHAGLVPEKQKYSV